jgi:protein-S-isoprenylcysteine O-methyltransferase Ste14
MENETPFRIAIAFLYLTALSFSGFFRRRAAQTGEKISSREEGLLIFVVLRLSGLLGFASVVAYVIHPPWMEWAAVPLPRWLRYLAAAVGLSVVPLLVWTLSALGRNITPTVVVRREHTLVTTGPYRWVRHPLYTFGLTAWFAVSVMAANVFMAALILIGGVGIVVRTPKEEARLLERFGDKYREYASRTGRFLPRIFL